MKHWLQVFGLASEALLSDRGRLGIGLRITPLDSRQSVDLTSVGVGVSQILPVIVLCLLSEPGRPGDLGTTGTAPPSGVAATTGRLPASLRSIGPPVARWRRTVSISSTVCAAESPTPQAQTRTWWACCSLRNTTASRSFRQAPIDPYGGSETEWPDVFFDVSAREAQALVATSLTKRHRHSA